MRERPVLFNTPMVQAVLAGTKTQTRRAARLTTDALKVIESAEHAGAIVECGSRSGGHGFIGYKLGHGFVSAPLRCPYGAPGDLLWVREAFTHVTGNGIRVHYRADGEPTDREGRVLPTEPGLRRWWPSIFMPRRISRITLEVTAVRVERLHEIDELGALAEGVEGRSVDGVLDGKRGEYVVGSARDAFAALWDEINGKPRPMLDDDGEPVLGDDDRPVMIAPQSWKMNPWVWVVEFKLVDVKPESAP